MRESIKEAIGETVQNLMDAGIKTSFTERELRSLGVKIPEVQGLEHDSQDLSR